MPLNKPETNDWPPAKAGGEVSHERARAESEEFRKPEDFSEVYETWFDEVSKWIRAMGGPDADRDDLVQEVFMVVHRRLGHFDGDNLAGWLYQITRRKVRDFRRRRWVRRLVFLEKIESAELDRTSNDPHATLETQQKRERLMKLLAKLNEDERVAILLFEVEGCSGQQIAALQSVPLNTVWTRIHKARQKLKAGLISGESGGKRVPR